MSRTSIQCPDSGLVVAFTYNPISQRVRVYGDESDWAEMNGSPEAIQATREWIKHARDKVEGRRITVEEVENALQVELNELTWEE